MCKQSRTPRDGLTIVADNAINVRTPHFYKEIYVILALYLYMHVLLVSTSGCDYELVVT